MKRENREQFLQEQMLREYIRKAIRVALTKQERKVFEEQKLRSIVRDVIQEVEVSEEVPHKSTGINVLEELLKKIVPILEDAYKGLTSNTDQRVSFRAHIVQAVQNSLATVKLNKQADKEPLHELEINVDDDEEDPPGFIDVDRPGKKEKESSPEEKEQEFTIAGQDLTGRNVALKAYRTIERNIMDAYDVLSDENDRQLFYDYLLTNLKLYFDKFEDELSTEVPSEPTTREYEAELDDEEEEYLDFSEEL
jgi:hypothetical protein|tara:strand:- start:21468 stop:22220 length:753 start_codon:yes stop_codon:yes gene_type:complete